jgi:hypothetical protein
MVHMFPNQRIQLWVNHGEPWNEKGWYVYSMAVWNTYIAAI